MRKSVEEKQIFNAFLIVHHNLHQLLFSVKFNPDKSILYFCKISVSINVSQ